MSDVLKWLQNMANEEWEYEDGDYALEAIKFFNSLRAENERLREALLDTTASLVASVSLLERGRKKAAPSDKMFAQMLVDYKNSIDRARAALEGVKEPASPWRDIESAPKDKEILVFGKKDDGDDYQEVCKYYDAANCWPIVLMHGYLAPTHWMPLPEPPQQSGDVK